MMGKEYDCGQNIKSANKTSLNKKVHKYNSMNKMNKMNKMNSVKMGKKRSLMRGGGD